MDKVLVKDAMWVKKYLGGYKKREVRVHPNTKSVSLFGCYWDGGSKYEYCVYNQGVRKQLVGKAPFSSAGMDEYILQPGDIVVQTGVFCGKTAIARIYLHDSQPQ